MVIHACTASCAHGSTVSASSNSSHELSAGFPTIVRSCLLNGLDLCFVCCTTAHVADVIAEPWINAGAALSRPFTHLAQLLYNCNLTQRSNLLCTSLKRPGNLRAFVSTLHVLMGRWRESSRIAPPCLLRCSGAFKTLYDCSPSNVWPEG